jgi:hypothetical protein
MLGVKVDHDARTLPNHQRTTEMYQCINARYRMVLGGVHGSQWFFGDAEALQTGVMATAESCYCSFKKMEWATAKGS